MSPKIDNIVKEIGGRIEFVCKGVVGLVASNSYRIYFWCNGEPYSDTDRELYEKSKI